MTTAMQLLTLIWEHGDKSSWRRINSDMNDALTLAVRSGLKFRAKDFPDIYNRFRAHYWICGDPEWIYALAIRWENKSCFQAWEEWKDRKPFFGRDVDVAVTYGTGSSTYRQRERLALRFGFKMQDRVWFVTGVERDHLRVALYKHDHQTGNPIKLRRLTHAECRAMAKKPKPAPEQQPAQEAQS